MLTYSLLLKDVVLLHQALVQPVRMWHTRDGVADLGTLRGREIVPSASEAMKST